MLPTFDPSHQTSPVTAAKKKPSAPKKPPAEEAPKKSRGLGAIRVAVEEKPPEGHDREVGYGLTLRIISGDKDFDTTKAAVDWTKDQDVVELADEGTEFFVIRAVKKVTVRPRTAFDVDEESF